jgi:acyl carrier protein
LGRIDHQVKIRGHRIELEEIENRLLANDTVKETVVVAKEDQYGNKYLCAYIVPGTTLPISDLRKYLSTGLPAYMLPSHFIRLERIPLTPNGKIDRKALPAPGIEAGEEYTAPRNAKEDKLAKIWSEVLGIEKETIGIDADFFKLGGHSLNATIMVSKIHKELNVKLPLSEVFKSPTIEGLAGTIKNAGENIYQSIQPGEKKEYYPLSSAQKRMFLVNQLKGDNLSDNTPGVLTVEGPLDKKRFEQVIKQLIKRHESFRTSFEILDEVPVQRVHDNVDIEIEYNECSSSEAEDNVQDFIRPFDLGKAPLLRAGLLKLSDREHILMYDIHHIINDALSSGIFINEFINLYEGVTLPPLKIQYRDFAGWQDKLGRSDAVRKQEAYWLKVFPGEIPVLHMPIDFPEPAVQSFEGDLIEFRFDKDLTRDLKQIMAECGATFYMMILAIYNILLSRYCGGEDIVVGTPAAGRPHADLENVVGMFVNTLAIRNYPKAEKTFTEFLLDVKTNTLDAFENQDYQFEELIKKLGIKPGSGRHPLFNTMFAAVLDVNVNLGVEGAVKRIKDLTFSPYPFDEKITQFDIIFHAFDMEEGITFRLKYCTKLFKRETIENFAGYFEEIASVVVNNKAVKLKDIQLSHDLVESTSAFSKENESHFEF